MKKIREIGLIWTFLVILVVWLFGRALFYGPNGEIIAGDRLVWTDWPLHLAMASSFAFGANFPPQNPMFAGVPLIYPFMADLVSGGFLWLGLNYQWAFALPGIVLTLVFFWVYMRVVGGAFGESKSPTSPKEPKSTKVAPFLALFMSLFWGGMGWWYWLQDIGNSGIAWIETLLSPPREYTFWAEKGLWFFTFLYSEILPQRAFVFGLPIFFGVLWLLKIGWEKGKPAFVPIKSGLRRGEVGFRYYIIAGVLAGISPFFHTHTFLSLWILTVAVFVVGGIEIFVKKGRSLQARKERPCEAKRRYLEAGFLFFLPFGLLSLLQLPLFTIFPRSIPFEFGWMKGSENFFLFWFKNTGFFIPLAILGLWKGLAGERKLWRLVGISSWILFILPNLFRFAPWGYDNLKILTYWYLLNAPFVVLALQWLWNIGKGSTRTKFFLLRNLSGPNLQPSNSLAAKNFMLAAPLRILVVCLFLSLTLSGIVEVGRLVDTPSRQITLWSREDQEFAEEIKAQTPAQAVFLTAAIHDHSITALAGRKIVIGFPGNFWSWGIPGWDVRERDVHLMFKGGEGARQLWKKYGIHYIIVSDRERYFEKELDEEFIRENSELILDKGDYKVYKIN